MLIFPRRLPFLPFNFQTILQLSSIWGLQDCDYEEFYLLECDAVWLL
jgi:hypothetical protein